MEQIGIYLEQIKELIALVVAIVVAIVIGYKEIMAHIKATATVTNITKGLILDAREDVKALKETLTKPLPLLPFDLPNSKADDERNAVVGAVTEKVKPNLLKKLGLTDPVKVANFVANIYQGIKVFLPHRK